MILPPVLAALPTDAQPFWFSMGDDAIQLDRQPRRYMTIVKVGAQTAYVDGDTPDEVNDRAEAVLRAMQRSVPQ